MPEAVCGSAQSQKWLFAAHELVRTWRQRAKDVRNWTAKCGLGTKLLAPKQKEHGFLHFGCEIRAGQIERVLKDPCSVEVIGDDVRRIDPTRLPFDQVMVASDGGAERWITRSRAAVSAWVRSTGAILGMRCGLSRTLIYRGVGYRQFRRIHAGRRPG